MKAAKKSKPETPKRGRPAKFGERQIVGARLAPETYQQLVAAAAVNHTSISAEIERRIEKSFEDNPAKPDNDLMHRVMEAFGARWIDIRPAEEWMKDPTAYSNGVIRAFEVMLAHHPEPNFVSFFLILVAVRSRLAERLLTARPDEDQILPALDLPGLRPRAPKPDTKEKKDEG